MYITEESKVAVGRNTLACSLDYLDSSKKPEVLFLHGAGPSDRNHTKYLSDIFIGNNQNVVRFDFPGHGESTGYLKESSLAKRQREAVEIINHFSMDTGNLTVVGTSMGGYIATSLCRLYPVKNLILFCPAAYDTIAWDVQFNKGFTEILRRDLSMLKSNIDELLADFDGKSLIVLAEKDDVIPDKVVDMYQRVLSKKPCHRTYIIPHCPHPVHRWAAGREGELEKIKEEIRKALGLR